MNKTRREVRTKRNGTASRGEKPKRKLAAAEATEPPVPKKRKRNNRRHGRGRGRKVFVKNAHRVSEDIGERLRSGLAKSVGAQLEAMARWREHDLRQVEDTMI